MTQINIKAPHPYSIHIGAGLLKNEDLFNEVLRGREVLIVSDENVAPLYASQLPVDGILHAIPAGEAHKNMVNFQGILTRLASAGAKRDATIIALGGGVVGDIAGFAAACWMRGIAFVQIPTTLLAMVDSSVGGKTAIDLEAGKNLVGAFHSPARVIIDTDALSTLPAREFAAGMAEVVKYGMIFDASFITWLEDHAQMINDRDANALTDMISRCVNYKAAVVERDPLEKGERALLNFGHTFAHAVEAEQGYGNALNHGEAVAVGMMLATRLSGLDTQRLEALLKQFDLPTQLPADLDPETLLARMQLDKKATRNGLRFIVLENYGVAGIADDIGAEAVLEVLRAQPL